MRLLTKNLFHKYLSVFLFACLYLLLGCKMSIAATFIPDSDLEVNPAQVYDTTEMFTYSDGNPSIIYLKFIMSSFDPNAYITSAVLQLTVDKDLSSENLSNVSIYYVADNNWDGLAQSYNTIPISWDNRPALSEKEITSGTFDGDQLMTWDLSKFNFKDTVDNNYTITFALKNTDNSDTNNTVFYSVDNADSSVPVLAINYGTPPVIPTTPEPSTIILGLVSFGSLLNIRRKNKYN